MNDPLIRAISSQLPTVTDEQVAMVLNAWNTVKTGEPLGTIVSDPETGNIAVRVADHGIHVWRVTFPDGETVIDHSPTLPGWDYLRQIDTQEDEQ